MFSVNNGILISNEKDFSFVHEPCACHVGLLQQ